jgi:hypothetical protein
MTLRVFTPYCNPIGWSSRLKNHRRFEDAIFATSGVALTTIELTYGDRPFDLPPREGITRLRYRSGDVLWHKENLIALAERQTSYEYAAYVDGDILFLDPEWAVKTVRTLQVLPVAQITSWLINMGPPPHEEGTRTAPSFMSVYLGDYETHRTEWFNNGSPAATSRHGYPGGCWAWRKQAYHDMGGMLDRCILGSADYHMAFGLVDLPADPVLTNGDYTKAYQDYIEAWRKQAFSAIRGHVGLVPGTAMHLWHGRTEDRGYETRPKILVRNKYDPRLDVRVRDDGLLELTDSKPMLRRDLLTYFASRHEDSVDTPRDGPSARVSPTRAGVFHVHNPARACGGSAAPAATPAPRPAWRSTGVDMSGLGITPFTALGQPRTIGAAGPEFPTPPRVL